MRLRRRSVPRQARCMPHKRPLNRIGRRPTRLLALPHMRPVTATPRHRTSKNNVLHDHITISGRAAVVYVFIDAANERTMSVLGTVIGFAKCSDNPWKSHTSPHSSSSPGTMMREALPLAHSGIPVPTRQRCRASSGRRWSCPNPLELAHLRSCRRSREARWKRTTRRLTRPRRRASSASRCQGTRRRCAPR